MNRRVKNRLQIFRTREECVFAKTELSVLTLDKSDFLKIFHQYDSFEGSVQTKFLKNDTLYLIVLNLNFFEH